MLYRSRDAVCTRELTDPVTGALVWESYHYFFRACDLVVYAKTAEQKSGCQLLNQLINNT